MEKKRFILFGFNSYYPSGGMRDAITSFDDREELIEKHSKYNCDYFNILDTETFKIGAGYYPFRAFDNLDI